ncbi:MAG: DUF445 domain-containing protein [Bacillota bacterium]
MAANTGKIPWEESIINTFYFISLPLIGAVIGWVTNWVAVRMLFRPHRPVNVLGYVVQGVIPKRRAELARSIGQVVEKELISIEDLINAARSREIMEKISEAVAVSIKARIMDRMPVFVPLSVKRAVSDIITDQIKKDIPSMVGESLGRLGDLARQNISFQVMVEERVNGFSLQRLEQVVLAVSARELKHIEVLGGMLGFLIGLIQAAIIHFTGGFR